MSTSGENKKANKLLDNKDSRTNLRANIKKKTQKKNNNISTRLPKLAQYLDVMI